MQKKKSVDRGEEERATHYNRAGGTIKASRLGVNYWCARATQICSWSLLYICRIFGSRLASDGPLKIGSVY